MLAFGIYGKKKRSWGLGVVSCGSDFWVYGFWVSGLRLGLEFRV
jgi:hypothetical protein